MIRPMHVVQRPPSPPSAWLLLASLALFAPFGAGCGDTGGAGGAPSTPASPASPSAALTDLPPAAPTPPEASPEPTGELLARIDCTADQKEFGRVWQGTHVAHEFTFTAAGDHDLKIVDYRPDCGCTVAHLEVLAEDGTRTPYVLNTPVPPGTRFALAVTFDTTNREGQQTKTIKIYANVPEGVREMSLSADIAPLFRVEPRSQAIELMTVLETRDTEFLVRGAAGERFLLTATRAGLPEALAVEVIPVDPDETQRATAWRVRAVLNPGMPKGIRSYSLELKTDFPMPDVPLQADGTPPPFVVHATLSAIVVGHVAAAPQNLNFGMLAADETVARTVVVTCYDPDFALPEPKVEVKPVKPELPFPLAETLRVTTRKVADENAWEVELLLEGLSPAVGRSFMGRMVIETGHPEEPQLEVTLSGLKRGS
jgi:hypothetical protein